MKFLKCEHSSNISRFQVAVPLLLNFHHHEQKNLVLKIPLNRKIFLVKIVLVNCLPSVIYIKELQQDWTKQQQVLKAKPLTGCFVFCFRDHKSFNINCVFIMHREKYTPNFLLNIFYYIWMIQKSIQKK